MSYVHFVDQHESGRLTDFCKRLSGEVQLQTGLEFPIFQDRKDIAWGQQWRERINESLDAVTFLIPILTASFFKSEPCRTELKRFLDREKQLNRNDLILPVYYVDSVALNEATKRDADPLAKVIADRQYVDWRELRFEPFTSPQVGKLLAKMATQIAEALDRAQAQRDTGPASQETVSRETSSSGVVISAQGAESPSAQSSGATRLPTQKTEPPTRVVDAFYRGDHATLTDALNAAQPGDRILVRPGLYQEGIVIEKPVEIIGDGDLADVIIEAKGKNVVLFKTSMGRIGNVTLRQTGGEGTWFGVDIAQGRLHLEGCDITSQSIACVGIHAGADPRLLRNHIHDGKDVGVMVYDNGQGTLEDNDIFANTFAGVQIQTGGNPTLRRNRIHDGKSAGVLVQENGQGTLEDNDIFANTNSGVQIRTGGNPTLRRNRIHDGKGGGVYVYDNGQGTLEDNEIFANASAGVTISEGGNPTLRRNRIHDGKGGGVFVCENGQGTLEDNDIFANTLVGVEIKTGANPALRRNRIHDGKGGGVMVWENGQGTLEDNDIFANPAGVYIKTGGNPTLRENRISKNEYQAIWISDGGGGVFEDNDLRGNEKGAWGISSDCLDKVKRERNLE
jgi:parallel beta-helix repeat protein